MHNVFDSKVGNCFSRSCWFLMLGMLLARRQVHSLLKAFLKKALNPAVYLWLHLSYHDKRRKESLPHLKLAWKQNPEQHYYHIADLHHSSVLSFEANRMWIRDVSFTFKLTFHNIFKPYFQTIRSASNPLTYFAPQCAILLLVKLQKP